MRRVQSPLAITLLFGGLFVLGYAWLVLVGGPIDFLFRSAAGLSTVRKVAEYATILAGIGVFVAAVIVGISAAFQPTSRSKRLLHVLPIYFLVLLAVAVIATLFDIGTTGAFFNVGMAQITMSSGAIILFLALSTVAVALAAGRVHLTGRTIKAATTVMGATLVPVVIAAVAVIASVVIVSTTTPSFSFGGPGGGGGQGGGAGGRNTPGGSGTQAAAGGSAAQNGPGGAGRQPGAAGTQDAAGAPAGLGTQAAAGGNAAQTGSGGAGGQAGGQPGAAGTQAAASGGAGQNGPGGGGQGGQPGGGQGGPGGGGPGGGLTSFVSTYRTTGIVIALFALIALFGAFAAVRAMRGLPTEQAVVKAPQVNYRREAGSVLASVVGISLAIFVVIQFVPVTRDNPPVQTTPNWDSPQTEQLFMTACSNCHSNLTKWPWYSYVAPSSWLQSVHVHDARAVFDISELNKLPAFMKNQMANNVKMHLNDKTMPPPDYLLLHPEARLTDAERQQLIDGMRATLAKS